VYKARAKIGVKILDRAIQTTIVVPLIVIKTRANLVPAVQSEAETAFKIHNVAPLVATRTIASQAKADAFPKEFVLQTKTVARITVSRVSVKMAQTDVQHVVGVAFLIINVVQTIVLVGRIVCNIYYY